MKQTRIVLRHDPEFTVGLIVHRRSRHPLRAFARQFARRLRDARALRGQEGAPEAGGQRPDFAASAARRTRGALASLLRTLPEGRGVLAGPRRGALTLRAGRSA